MTWLATLMNRFLALFKKEALEEQLATEVALHLEMETEENIRRGDEP